MLELVFEAVSGGEVKGVSNPQTQTVGQYGNDNYSFTLNKEIKKGLLFISTARGGDPNQIDGASASAGKLTKISYTKKYGHDNATSTSSVYYMEDMPQGTTISAWGWGGQTSAIYKVIEILEG